jgi:hypothetical protein
VVAAADEPPEPAADDEQTLIDARMPMFARYSRWIGETLRNTEKERSSGCPSTARNAGTMRAGV